MNQSKVNELKRQKGNIMHARSKALRLLTTGMLSWLLVSVSLAPAALSDDSAATMEANVQKAVQLLDNLAQKQIDDKAVVGLAVCVVYKDKCIFSKGYGLRDVGKDAKVDADTVFQLASVSKPVGATVVAGLVGDGKVRWDSKISDLDPSFQMYDDYVTREVTIRDMYAHRSGLPDHAGDLLEDMGYDRQQVLHRLRYQKPDSSFRSHYAYTNFGLTEGAVAAARTYLPGESKTKMDWELVSDERLYKPLGMTSTSSRHSDFIARSNRALNHVFVDGKWVQKYDRQPDPQSPAGGVSSSVNDLAKWLRLRLAKGRFDGKQVIDEKALAETEAPQMFTHFSPLDGAPGFYGLGMNVNYDHEGRLRLSHSGAFALGAATSISLVPSEQVGVVVLSNCYPIGIAESLTTSFTDQALYGKQTQDWFALYKKVFSDPATLGLDKTFDYSKPPKAPSAALKNSAYLGTYSNDLYGSVSVNGNAEGLSFTFGPNKLTFPLKHYDRDTFTFRPPGENSPGLSGVTFTIGAGGEATSLVVEYLNENGQGVFPRAAK